MIFVLNQNKDALDPCHPAVARKLLKGGKAAIYRKYPFSLILLEQVKPATTQDYRLKIDYGSRHTGLAILQNNKVMWMAQIEHKTTIKKNMYQRAGYRRRRRTKNLRYREPRFYNRTRPAGWLPPSLQSRVDNIATWTQRLMAICPITAISYENLKFDTQLMRNPEISGIEYQQGTLYGYEVREYLLEKYQRKCAYCGATGVPLEVEHIIPKSRPGTSNRIDNLCMACKPCNDAKDTMTAEEFGYPDLQKQIKASLRDVAIINATRWKVYKVLKATGLPVECGTGARTKMNRIQLGIDKKHHLDACCVGASTPDTLIFITNQVLYIKAIGRGQHRRTNSCASGFPVGYLPRKKYFFGYQTGDMVKAVIPKGKHSGTHYGRIKCRTAGRFSIVTSTGRKDSINHKYMTLLHRNDGYGYKVSSIQR